MGLLRIKKATKREPAQEERGSDRENTNSGRGKLETEGNTAGQNNQENEVEAPPEYQFTPDPTAGRVAKKILKKVDDLMARATWDARQDWKHIDNNERKDLEALYNFVISLRLEAGQPCSWWNQLLALQDLLELRAEARKFYDDVRASRDQRFYLDRQNSRDVGSTTSVTPPPGQGSTVELYDPKAVLKYLSSIKSPADRDFAEAILNAFNIPPSEEARFQDSVRDLINRSEVETGILRLDDRVILCALDVLQRAVDMADAQCSAATSTGNQPSRLRTTCEEILRHVSNRSGRLPPSILIQGIKCDSKHFAGRGGSAGVYKAVLGKGTRVALKVLCFKDGTRDDHKEYARKMFRREAIIWRQLHHRNILPLIGVCETSPDWAGTGPGLVSPWCDKGSLTVYIRNHPHKCNRIFMLERIADSIAYLHSHKVVHKDIKPSNIVVNDKDEPCLTDFGISTYENSYTVTAEVGHSGSRGYIAPEILISVTMGENNQYIRESVTTACDMYAFASVCLEVYTLEHPWKGIAELMMHNSIVKGEHPPRPSGKSALPDALWSIMEQCWTLDPMARMTSAAAQKALSAMLSVEGLPISDASSS
ncbi:kinase-like protein [Gloeophyllum trabeum ATCC 11539]|uniref:Kinase-like protein n=1 Tax=Gloeophyllum trabeum (strain ATCC 11539 / FP-39264 / Madison 617) TaxID=670483 RepID=S7QCJ5_GLOTA|nr:kinase-like protein [Gloeophyllum trabeum ATCC 11539]EPQ57113.1 kinase-like protein [Gloeophyllum trabeum ATCC 11539]